MQCSIRTIVFINFLESLGIVAPMTIFPVLAKQKGMNTILVGITFSVSSIGMALSSLVSGKIMGFFHKKNIVFATLSIISISRMAFGSLYYIDNIVHFNIQAIISRLSYGIGLGMLNPALHSIVSELNPEEMTYNFANMGLARSISNTMAPPLVFILYTYTDFFWTFIILGSTGFFFGIIPWKAFVKIDQLQIFKKEEKTINYLQILKKFKFLINVFAYVLTLLSFLTALGSFQIYIVSLGLGSNVGSILVIPNGVGLLLANSMIRFVYKPQRHHTWIIINIAINMICSFLIGPDPTFGIENLTGKIVCIEIAMFFFGLSRGCLFATILSYLIVEMKQEFPEHEDHIKDAIPGIYYFFLYGAELTSNIVGVKACEVFGFERANTYAGFFSLTYIGVYIVYLKISSINHTHKKLAEEES